MDMIECKGKTVDEAVFTGLMKMDLSIDEVKIEILDEGGSLFKSAKVRLTKKTEEDLKADMAEPPVHTQQERSVPRDRRENNRERSGGSFNKDRSSNGSNNRERSGSGSNNRERSGGSINKDRNSEGPRRDKRNDYPRSAEDWVSDPNFVPQEPVNQAEKFLLGLFKNMNMNVRLKSSSEEGILKIDMSGRGMGMLIGRRGETLDALQYLTSLVLNNGKEDYTKVMLDTEDYRKKREDTLRHLATRLADKVQKSGKRVVLEPMNPYERRILHSTLQDYENVYTYSEGEDPFRSVVVTLKGSEDERKDVQRASNK